MAQSKVIVHVLLMNLLTILIMPCLNNRLMPDNLVSSPPGNIDQPNGHKTNRLSNYSIIAIVIVGFI